LTELVFVGLGLHDEKGISVCGMEEVSKAQTVFIELYTSLLPDFSKEHFEETVGKKLHLVTRRELEDENGRVILESAKNGRTVLLVPGDPLIATTHITLRIEAVKHGVKTRIVHGASILSAVIGLSGLHNYKFGKTVTLPFPEETYSQTPYEVISQNKKHGLHTLCLLDIKTEQKRYLDIGEGLASLLAIEKERKLKTVTPETLAVGIARAGNLKPLVRAAYVKDLLDYDFGRPPYSIIFPGDLHFMEAEALIVLANGPRELKKAAK